MRTEDQFQVIDNYLCIRMPREIDHHNAGQLSQQADNYLCHSRVNHILFDFEDTEFMDSSGIGIIAGRYKKVQCFGGKIYVINAGKQVRRILSLSGLLKYVILMKE